MPSYPEVLLESLLNSTVQFELNLDHFYLLPCKDPNCILISPFVETVVR